MNIELDFLEEICKEAQKQGNIDSVVNAFWMLFSHSGGDGR